MSHAPARIAPLAAGLAVTTLLIAGCRVDAGSGADDGPTVTESYDVGEFEHLVVTDSWTVLVTVGPEASLEVEVAEDLLDDVEVDQSGDRLTLSLDGPRWFSSHRGRREATITTPNLTDLDVEGASTVEVVGLTGDDFDADLAGAVTVDLGEIDLRYLNIGLEGASSIAADGTADVVTIDAEGASSVDFTSMSINEAQVDAAGASSLELDRAAAVSGRLAGASSVDVADDASVSLQTTGLSSID